MAYGPRHPCRYLLEDRLEMKSVHIWERPTKRRIFTDVRRAASFALNDWPAEFRGTGKHREAIWQAEMALSSSSSDEFRIAFIVAAAEAGILAPRVGDPDPEMAGKT